MAKEAEAHADEDKAKKELVEARNLLDGAVYQAEKLKKDYANKISEDDEKTLDEAVESAKKIVEDEKASKDDIEKAAKDLNDKLMPIGAKMYETAEGEAEDKEEADDTKTAKKAKKGKDETIEGEVVDDKEK
jgi:molecular chaperone DnaK